MIALVIMVLLAALLAYFFFDFDNDAHFFFMGLAINAVVWVAGIWILWRIALWLQDHVIIINK